jgi:hypothetical protein
VIAGNYIANVNTQDNRSDLFTGGVRLYSGSDGVDTVTIVGNTIINANHGVFLRPFLTGSPAVEQPTMLANNINISNNNITNSVNGGITNGAFDVTGTYSGTNNYFAGNVGGDFISLDPDSDPNNTSAPAPSALLLDRDGDGLSDAAEVYIYGTDPDLFDTDGDGVSDGIEVALGTNPLDKGSSPEVAQIPGTGDTDGDGYRDDYEVLVGTDPSKASSRPRLGDVNGNGVIDNGDAAILFQVISGNLPPFAFDTTRFDVNQDGIVNNQDANILFNRFLGVPGFELLPYRP